MSSLTVYLTDGPTGLPVEAELILHLDRETLEDTDTFWRLAARRLSAKAGEKEHAHWNWAAKFDALSEEGEFLAIEQGGLIEGLMLLRFDRRARLRQQQEASLIYVDYLEVAPWNLAVLNPTPRYRGVGSLLIQIARQVSQDYGWQGRIGLHSLPQSEGFYRRAGLDDLGVDANYGGLRYFESKGAE